ncbi:MAG: DUF2505 domain-containing protein, partial [Polyangia bacterium]
TWELDCSVEKFWDVFCDAEYSRSLYLDGLGFKDYRVVSADPADRKLALVPKLNVPGPVAKLLGDAFAYEQHGQLDRGASVWTWRMVQPGGKKGIVSSDGTIRVLAAGEGRCRRTDEVHVTAHVFGLGGVIESSVEKELLASWEAELAFFRRWVATK